MDSDDIVPPADPKQVARLLLLGGLLPSGIALLLGLCVEMKTALILVTHSAVHAAKTSRKTLLHEGKLHDVV